jgi:competence protein ComER
LKKVGFIGTGSMGRILVESLLDARAISSDNVIVMNRTADKAYQLASSYPGLKVVHDPRAIVTECSWIFLCVKPLQMFPVIKRVNDLLDRRKTLISITSPVLTDELEEISDCQVVRFIPSIVNRAMEGPSLVTFGEKVEETNKQELLRFFSTISRPQMIGNGITRIASDLASCGPAFISYLVEEMIKSAVEETDIKEDEAIRITESMLIGYGELLKRKHFTLETLRKRVTVPGGVTGAGLEVLRDEIGDQFNLLFRRTHEKYAEDRQLVCRQIKEKEKSKD